LKWKSRTNLIVFMIFITRLHNKPSGCGAYVASAAGPFHKNKSKIYFLSAKINFLKYKLLL
jgi:hypothetical protein